MSDTGIDPEIAARHAEKMAKKRAARDKIMATKDKTGGLLIVHTGKGKGKSTAAFGMVCRAIGHGMKVGVVQFVKGKWETGERKVRSEEHTSELQSLMRISYAVFCLKKKNTNTTMSSKNKHKTHYDTR